MSQQGLQRRRRSRRWKALQVDYLALAIGVHKYAAVNIPAARIAKHWCIPRTTRWLETCVECRHAEEQSITQYWFMNNSIALL
jgi:hypothetical protein